MDTEARLKKIKSLAHETIHEVDLLLQDEKPKNPVTNIAADWVERNLIKVSWLSQVPGVRLNIQFYDAQEEKEWQHSVLKYNPSAKILSEKGEHLIRLGASDTDHHPWAIRIVSVNGEFVSEQVPLPVNENAGEEEDFPKIYRNLKVGLWDSHNAPKEIQKLFNMGLALSPNRSETQPVVDLYGKVIPTIGGFSNVNFSQNESVIETQLRRKVRNRVSQFEKIGWEKIIWVNLQDEPKYDVKWQEIIVDEARKQYKVPAGFTYTANAINTNKYPKNLEIVPFNGYPFFRKNAPRGYKQIWTKKEFFAYYEKMVQSIHERIPGAKLAFTAQCFSARAGKEPPWRKPPLDSPKWYLEVAGKYKATLLLWQYRNVDTHRWKCLEGHADIMQAWKDILNQNFN